MKITVLDGFTLNPGDLSWEELAALGELTVYDRTAPGETAARIGDAEIVFTNKTPLGAELLNAAPSWRPAATLWISLRRGGAALSSATCRGTAPIPLRS